MKKTTKKKIWMGILAVALVFGMTFVGCEDEPVDDPTDNNDGQKTDVVFTSIDDMAAWLSAQPENTATTPYTVKLNVSDLGGNVTTSGSAGYALRNSGSSKYVSLDLSGSTITTIPESAFQVTVAEGETNPRANLISIIIPNSVTSIGNYAFSSCSGLSSITIPDSVTSIGEQAFYFCTSLTNITIPSKVTSIKQQAFYQCTNIISVKFEGTITDENFGSNNYAGNLTSPFPGDLRDKYLAGGIGTYTTTSPVSSSSVWTKQ